MRIDGARRLNGPAAAFSGQRLALKAAELSP